MGEVSKLIVGVVLVLGAMHVPSSPSQTQQNSAIKVSITTGGGLFGPPKARYQVGESVPVSITMTNNSNEPVEICDSDTAYQDRPRLLKDGKPLPYITGQTQILRTEEADRICSRLNVPDPVILKPKESRVVDWFILTEGNQLMGDMVWYEPLLPGKYELSIERRLGCCDGPMFQSNKINFEVLP